VSARAALRDIVSSWGNEFVGIIWKVVMTHRQAIEDRLIQQFPETSILTEVEKRLMDRALKEMEEFNSEVIQDTADMLLATESESTPDNSK